MKKISIAKIEVMGIPLLRWKYESCTADLAVGPDWATIYFIASLEEWKGHATTLLKAAKRYYEARGKRFGGSVALNDRMKRIYKRLKITEYAN